MVNEPSVFELLSFDSSKTAVYRGIHYFSNFAKKHRLLEPPRRGGSNEYPESMF